MGTLSSAWNFFRQGHLDIKPLYRSLVMAILGSVAGTCLVQSLNGTTLSRLIPFLLLGIALYFLVSPKVSSADSHEKISRQWFACTAALGMGLYGGFFGPGMGTIMPFLFVWLLGHNLVKATAGTKLMILAVNGSSALIFVFSGYVIWQLAIGMSIAQILGARLGSNLVMIRGANFVQPIITWVAIVMAIQLLFFT